MKPWISSGWSGLSLQTCFEQLARTLINSGPKLKLVGGHAKGSPTFFAQRPETTHRIPGEAGARLLTSGVRVGRLKRRSQRRGARDPIALMTAQSRRTPQRISRNHNFCNMFMISILTRFISVHNYMPASTPTNGTAHQRADMREELKKNQWTERPKHDRT